MKRASEAAKTLVNKRVKEVFDESSGVDRKMKLINSMLTIRDHAVLVFAAIEARIVSDNGNTSLSEIMNSKELDIDHKIAFTKYLLKNNVPLIEKLIQDNPTPSVKYIIEQAIGDFKQGFSQEEQVPMNNSDVIGGFLADQSRLKTKVAQPLHQLANKVHEHTRQRGVPDGTASATTAFLAAAAVFGTGIGPAIALAAAAGYVGGKFGDKHKLDGSTAVPMDVDQEYEALLALREPMASLLSKQVSATNVMFALANMRKCLSIKEAFENPRADFEPTIIEAGSDSCIFFKDSHNTLKIGVMKGKPSAEGTQVTVLNVSDILGYKDRAPTKEEYASLPKSNVEVTVGQDGIKVKPLDAARRLKQ